MVALVLVLLLLAAEFLLRGYHALTFRQRLPIELRAETRSLTREDIEHKYRIVCLGDSNTFGADLPYAQTYPAVLQDLLRDKHPDLNVAVINAGICGDTSVQGLARLDRDVFWYEPEVVVSAFGPNDGKLGHWPLDLSREQEMYRKQTPAGRVESWLEHSHLYLTLRARGHRLLRSLGWQPAPPAVSAAQELQPRVSHDVFADAQERLVARTQQHGAALVMATTPVTEACCADLELAQRQRQLAIYDEYNHIVRSIAAQHGAHLVDIQAIFGNEAHSEWPSLLAADGVHWTAAGQRLVALSTLQALEASGLMGPVIASYPGGEAVSLPTEVEG
jgi:lysophospholipase L1-like esterase